MRSQPVHMYNPFSANWNIYKWSVCVKTNIYIWTVMVSGMEPVQNYICNKSCNLKAVYTQTSIIILQLFIDFSQFLE